LKGLDVLEILAEARSEPSLSEVARATGLARTTSHRILGVLESRGYVERASLHGGYRLGLKVWQLGSRVVGQRRLRDVARPFLERLAAETEEHVNLAVLDGHDSVFIDIIESSKPIRPYTYVGGRVPTYCSATGKAMLAFQPDATITALIHSGLKAFTSRTIVRGARLREELRRVRKQGYGINAEEWREDVWGLAAPIRNHAGAVVAAVSVTTPRTRFDERGLRPRVMAAGRGISKEMGWLDDGASRDQGSRGRTSGSRRNGTAR
jgi:DNA-binding IclR family transcriptional regulator